MAFLGGYRITRTGMLFVLGVLVLVGLVFGGIWLVRERGEQARRQEAIKVAEQNLEDQSQTPVAVETDKEEKPAEEDKPQTQAPTTSSSANTLPETGPEILPILVIGLLTLATGYYVTSRRAVREL